tara:strand:- start:1567 stop:1764 length:198 start_codon:yes stop_codon:yes gene_type:complete
MNKQQTSIQNNERDRRKTEMRRRILFLEHKRYSLERELNDIKDALVSMNIQIQKDKAYDQYLQNN